MHTYIFAIFNELNCSSIINNSASPELNLASAKFAY
jgi:hypothetical protein